MTIGSKKSVIGVLILLLFSFLSLPSLSDTPRTIYVDGNYGGPIYDGTLAHPYPTISAGLNKLNPGDTLYVFDDTYYEHITVNIASITITGQDKDITILDGNGAGDTITLTADSITLQGFTIRNAGTAGIKIQTSHNTITDTIITMNNGPGLLLTTGTSDNTISHSLITQNNGNGISLLRSDHNTISDNTITQNTPTGIKLLDTSNNNIISENSLQSNTIGINISKDSGQDSNNNRIYHNIFRSNTRSAYDSCTNYWDNGATDGGNFWSDYLGNDGNGDGIGEATYNLLGGTNKDHYPFIYENGWDLRLSINAPSTVQENSAFQVTVTANGNPIPNALVEFGGNNYYTTSNGIAIVTSPNVAQNVTLQLFASLTGYVSDSQSITVINTPVTQEPVLEITAPSSVNEDTIFIITVTTQSIPVSAVTITFNSDQYTTNTSGGLTLLAPSVEDNTDYMITATKNGYQSAQKTITIQNLGVIDHNGSIDGIIYDLNDNPIKNVTICATQIDTQYCATSNDDGAYHLSLPPGIYALSASKEGYVPVTIHNVLISEGSTRYRDIQILQRTTTPPKQLGTQVIQSTITHAAEAGQLLATIDVQPLTDAEIITFGQQVEITNISHTEKHVNFTIGGPDGPTGKYLAILIGEGTLEDIQNINLTYDGLPVQKVPLVTLFSLTLNTTDIVQWTNVLTLDENNTAVQYVIVWIPHFSQHALSIFSFESLPKPIQQFSQVALIGAIIVTLVAAYLAYRRGKEF
ncbi:MAG: NosD domain-containing protein [Methanobacteriota archaeon]